MDKESFVRNLANRIKSDAVQVEAAVDATLAELVSVSIFATDATRRGIFDNNCNNNCKAEQAAIPTPQRI